MEELKESELVDKLYDYISENYYFETCDMWNNEMQFTLENGEVVVVSLKVKVYRGEE